MSREKETEGEEKYVPSLSHAIVYLLQRYRHPALVYRRYQVQGLGMATPGSARSAGPGESELAASAAS